LTGVSSTKINNLKQDYQKLLFLTIAHEKIGPLRNIVSLTENMIQAQNDEDINSQSTKIANKDLKMLWGESKLLSLQMES
jgi:hypothetical protein